MTNVGERVLICDVNWKVNNLLGGKFKPLYGTVEKQYRSDDRSYHGSPVYDTITVVQGDDGKIYTDDSQHNQESAIKSFYTEEQFNIIVKNEIRRKEETINSLNAEIKSLKKQLIS